MDCSFFSREGQSNFNFFTFFFFPYDSQPRFPLSTTIIQQSFLLLHQNNNNCWNQPPIKTKLSLKVKVQQNHHHFPPKKRFFKSCENLAEATYPKGISTLRGTTWKLEKPARSCLFPSTRERERQPNRAEIDPWTLPYTPLKPTRFPPCITTTTTTSPCSCSVYCPTCVPHHRKHRMWHQPDPDHHQHHQSLLIVYKVKPSITNHYNQKRQPSTPF